MLFDLLVLKVDSEQLSWEEQGDRSPQLHHHSSCFQCYSALLPASLFITWKSHSACSQAGGAEGVHSAFRHLWLSAPVTAPGICLPGKAIAGAKPSVKRLDKRLCQHQAANHHLSVPNTILPNAPSIDSSVFHTTGLVTKVLQAHTAHKYICILLYFHLIKLMVNKARLYVCFYAESVFNSITQ